MMWFLIGLMVGAIFGLFIAALISAPGDDSGIANATHEEDHNEY